MAENFKILGQSAPAATTDTNLYTVPANTQAIISTIVIANRSLNLAAYRIAARPAGATIADQHYIAYDVSVAGGDSTTITLGLTLDATDVITVRSTSNTLSFSVFGSEITN
jgi:hypothetical protein